MVRLWNTRLNRPPVSATRSEISLSPLSRPGTSTGLRSLRPKFQLQEARSPSGSVERSRKRMASPSCSTPSGCGATSNAAVGEAAPVHAGRTGSAAAPFSAPVKVTRMRRWKVPEPAGIGILPAAYTGSLASTTAPAMRSFWVRHPVAGRPLDRRRDGAAPRHRHEAPARRPQARHVGGAGAVLDARRLRNRQREEFARHTEPLGLDVRSRGRAVHDARLVRDVGEEPEPVEEDAAVGCRARGRAAPGRSVTDCPGSGPKVNVREPSLEVDVVRSSQP